jgi:hypothetical protein
MILREKQNIIPFLAITVLLIASASTLYVHANQTQQFSDSKSISIKDESYAMLDLFQTFSNTTIQTDDGEKTGISLSELLRSTGIECPTCHSYIFIASDGYQQTVSWEDIEQGILTYEKRSYFPHLAHAFWVHDIIKIEVN